MQSPLHCCCCRCGVADLSGITLVTGATGFIGRAVALRLAAAGVPVRLAVRDPANVDLRYADVVRIANIDALTDWTEALHGVDAVVHCAARVHALRDPAKDPLAAFRAINRDGSARLAEEAARAGVRRFVFISTIGVNGAETTGLPFTPADSPRPHSPYAVSKHEAEQALKAIDCSSGLGVVVIRPPLVYGPNAPGNFGTLLRAMQAGLPLPLGAISNRRAFIFVENLVDLIVQTLSHEAASGKTLLVSDGLDISTTRFLQLVAHAMSRPARLIPVPGTWVRAALTALGRADVGQQLCGSLEIDIEDTKRLLGWEPPTGTQEALVRATQHFGPGNEGSVT